MKGWNISMTCENCFRTNYVKLVIVFDGVNCLSDLVQFATLATKATNPSHFLNGPQVSIPCLPLVVETYKNGQVPGFKSLIAPGLQHIYGDPHLSKGMQIVHDRPTASLRLCSSSVRGAVAPSCSMASDPSFSAASSQRTPAATRWIFSIGEYSN